jgi:hypothetical protein
MDCDLDFGRSAGAIGALCFTGVLQVMDARLDNRDAEDAGSHEPRP